MKIDNRDIDLCNPCDYRECPNFYLDVFLEEECENIICYCKLTLDCCKFFG